MSVPIPGRPALLEVWRFRELLRNLVLRNLRIKYQRSILGFAWTLLNPLLTVGILVVVFSHIIRIPVPHYWAFLLSSYFVWNFAAQTLSAGTHVLPEHSQLTRSVAFPGEVLLFSAALSRLAEFALELLLVLPILVLFHHEAVPASFLLLPVLVAIQIVMVVGILLPLATMSAFYTDVQHALPVLLLMLFYASPVFYPADLVPESIRQLYFLNPLAGLLTLYHTVLYEGEIPSLRLLGTVAGTALVLCILGYAIFNRYKKLFAEIL